MLTAIATSKTSELDRTNRRRSQSGDYADLKPNLITFDTPKWETSNSFVTADGRHLVSYKDETYETSWEIRHVHVWCVESGKAVEFPDLPGPGREVVSFSPDGSLAITGVCVHNDLGRSDKYLTHDALAVVDLATGKEIHRFEGDPDEVRVCRFSPDGNYVFLRRFSVEPLGLWNTRTGSLVRVFNGQNGYDTMDTLPDFIEGGTRFVSYTDQKICVWDAATGELEYMVFDIPKPQLDLIPLIRSSRILVQTGEARWDIHPLGLKESLGRINHPKEGLGSVSLWKMPPFRGKEAPRTISHPKPEFGSCSLFVPPREESVITTDGSLCRLWDVASGELACQWGSPGRRNYRKQTVSKFVASPSGHYLVTWSRLYYHKIRRISDPVLRDAATGTIVHRLQGHGAHVYCANFSPDESRLLTSSLDGTLRIWDIETGRETACLPGRSTGMMWADFACAGTRVMTFDEQDRIQLWNFAN